MIKLEVPMHIMSHDSPHSHPALLGKYKNAGRWISPCHQARSRSFVKLLSLALHTEDQQLNVPENVHFLPNCCHYCSYAQQAKALGTGVEAVERSHVTM